MLVYFALFTIWKEFPSRTVFLFGGLSVAVAMMAAMRLSYNRGYFQNRVDLSLHSLVILDVVLEALSFEAFSYIWQVEASPTAALQFHNNTNFYGCTAIFAVLIGGYRLASLQRARFQTTSEHTEPDHIIEEERS